MIKGTGVTSCAWLALPAILSSLMGCDAGKETSSTSSASSHSTSTTSTSSAASEPRGATTAAAPTDEAEEDDAPEIPAAGEPDFLAEPKKVPALFASLSKPTQIIGMKIKGASVTIDVRRNDRPEQADAYTFRKGAVSEPRPMKDKMAELKTGTVLDLDKIDFAVVEAVVSNAVERAAIDDGKVTAVDLMQGQTWRVRIDGPRASARVDYALDGTFKKMKK